LIEAKTAGALDGDWTRYGNREESAGRGEIGKRTGRGEQREWDGGGKAGGKCEKGREAVGE
jgi:hypothetical protein